MTTNSTRAQSRSTARSWALFALGATTIVLAWVALIRHGFAARHPSISATGAALDLVVTIPLLYYFVVVRRGLASGATIIPVAAAGLVVARVIVPGSPGALLVAGAIAEGVIVVAAIVRVRAAVRIARRGGAAADAFGEVERLVRGLFPSQVVADALLYELRVIDWALFRRGERARRGLEGVFPWKAADEWLVVVIALSVVIVAESLALHVFLAPRIGSLIWLVTALDLYAIVWLVADSRALGRNGITVSETGLSIRFGVRWEAEIEFDQLERIEPAANANWDRKLALIEEPTLVIVTRRPVTLRGPYGLRREASRIGIRVDDDARLEAALAAQSAAKLKISADR